MKPSLEDLYKQYGEAVVQANIWSGKAQQLLSLIQQEMAQPQPPEKK